MTSTKTLLTIALASLMMLACNDVEAPQTEQEGRSSKNMNANPTTRPELSRLEVPHIKGTSDNIVVVHKTSEFGVNYILEWDCTKKTQRWSCYTLDNSNSAKKVSRYVANKGESQYPKDPDIPSAYTFNSDPYYGTGYDHGHICPSYDRLNSKDANYQTFYISNMQPQRNAFNAGIWLKLENLVSNTGWWNNKSFRDTLYVCKGGTIDNASQILGKLNTGLIVPKYFFMAILCKNSQGYKAIGFWVEHLNEDRSNDRFTDLIVSIDDLESLTGIDFFCNLPDDIEATVEKNAYPSDWGL